MQTADERRARRINAAILETLPDGGGDPTRPGVYRLNQQLRDVQHKRGVPGDWGYVALNIPPRDMRILWARYPDLQSPDVHVQTAAWKKFIASPESAPYKVFKRDGQKGLLLPGVAVR